MIPPTKPPKISVKILLNFFLPTHAAQWQNWEGEMQIFCEISTDY